MPKAGATEAMDQKPHFWKRGGEIHLLVLLKIWSRYKDRFLRNSGTNTILSIYWIMTSLIVILKRGAPQQAPQERNQDLEFRIQGCPRVGNMKARNP